MIDYISFLYKGERVVVKANSMGFFRVPVSYVRNASIKTEYRNLRALQVVKHKIIKNCDPVATLESGEKIRIYQGGNPSYLPAMSEGILCKHDDFYRKKTAFKEQTSFFDVGDWGGIFEGAD